MRDEDASRRGESLTHVHLCARASDCKTRGRRERFQRVSRDREGRRSYLADGLLFPALSPAFRPRIAAIATVNQTPSSLARALLGHVVALESARY